MMQQTITSRLDHDGCQLAYTVEGNGPPVLFIQGTGLHGGGWQPQVDELAAHYRCLSFDNRGMGQSQPGSATLSVAQMAGDARALLDSQGWESAHIVGHSLGGLVALLLALDSPTRVRSLALLCTFAQGSKVLPLSPAVLWTVTRMSMGPRAWRRRAFLELVVPPAVLAQADRNALAAQLAPFFGHDLGEQPPVANQQLKAMRACDLTSRLHELAQVPSLVVSAAHDLIAPPQLGRALADGIPGARYVEISDAAHGVTIHQAGRINALLESHFATVDMAHSSNSTT